MLVFFAAIIFIQVFYLFQYSNLLQIFRQLIKKSRQRQIKVRQFKETKIPTAFKKKKKIYIFICIKCLRTKHVKSR